VGQAAGGGGGGSSGSSGTSGVSGAGTLDDLTDVEITSPQDGDILVYDSTSNMWINQINTGGTGTAYFPSGW